MSPVWIFMEGGFLMFPLVFILLVLFLIVLHILWHILIRGGTDTAVIQNGLDGLLFWGGFAVIIGALGTVVGYHKAMAHMAAHGLSSYRALWIGTAEGMVSSIAGLLVLTVAGALWFVLRWSFLRRRQPTR
jgi:hypothetical protein